MLKKVIVTTTINDITPALRAYDELQDWHLIVIGDKKTPDLKLKNGDFYPWTSQDRLGFKCIKMIPWNVIQRRNIAILLALKEGADIIAVIDDDNIPLKHWGQEIYAGTTANPETVITADLVVDPLAIAESNQFYDSLWHRGYPIQLLQDREGTTRINTQNRCIDVQAGLWNGEPDVDAICRIPHWDGLDISFHEYFRNGHKNIVVENGTFVPFNTQNTIMSRRAAKMLCLPYDIGRMDDIWAGYMIQRVLREVGGHVMFEGPTVYQKRNPHDLSKDLEAEMIGYRHTLSFLRHLNTIDLHHHGCDAMSMYDALVTHVGMLPFIDKRMTVFQRAWIEDVMEMS
jgi:hypothetical protein